MTDVVAALDIEGYIPHKCGHVSRFQGLLKLVSIVDCHTKKMYKTEVHKKAEVSTFIVSCYVVISGGVSKVYPRNLSR